MKINSSQFREVMYVFLILSFLLVVSSIYYFGHVTPNETEINDRAVRALSKINENIQEKKITLIKNIKSSHSYLKDTPKKETLNKIHNNDTLNKILADHQFNKEIIAFLDKGGSDNAGDISFSENRFRMELDSLSDPVNSNKKIRFYITIENLVKSFIRKDVFDHFVMYKNKKSIYQDFPSPFNIDSLIKGSNSFIQLQNQWFKPYIYQSIGSDLVICGLKNKSRYNEERFGISTSSIFIVSLVIIVISLLFPFIKLGTMDKFERLKSSTILSAWTILILGVSLIFLMILNFYTIYYKNPQKINANLDSLSTSISKDFVAEIAAAIKQLSEYDSSLNQRPINFYSDAIPADSFAPPIRYGFNNIFSVDSLGKQGFKFSRKKKTTAEIDVNDREYFKRIRNNTAWYLDKNLFLSHSTGTINRFYLESNYSYIDGMPQAVISAPPSDSLKRKYVKAIALSTELRSVIDPVLPSGYGFAIIDQNGKVLFHNNKEKNSQENFLEECTPANSLYSAISQETALSFDTRYSGENYKMLIKPIKVLPLFLVTYYDESYTNMINSEVLLLSAVFIFLVFVFCCFHVLLQQLFRKKYVKIKQTALDFEWIIPLKENGANYFIIILTLIPLVLISIVCSNAILYKTEPSFYSLLYLSILGCIFSFFIIYNLLNVSPSGKTKNSVWSKNTGFNLSTFLLFLIVNSFIVFNVDEKSTILWFEGVSVLVIGLAFIFWKKLQKKFYFINNRYKWSYIILLLFWLSITSGLPAFYSYNLSLMLEEKFAAQLMHTDLIEKKEKREEQIKAYRTDLKMNCDTCTIDRVYVYSNEDIKIDRKGISGWKKDTCYNCKHYFKYDPLTKEYKSTLDFLSRLPAYNSFTENRGALAIARTSKDSLSYPWRYHNQDTCYSLHMMPNTGENENQSNYCLTSALPYFKTPPQLGLVIIGFSIFIFLVLKFFIEKAFYLQEVQLKKFNPSNYDLSKNNLFIVTPPNSDILCFLNEKFNIDPEEIDLACLKEQESLNEKKIGNDPQRYKIVSDTKTIVINHFDFDIDNIDTGKRTLSLVEELIRHKKPIVIVSSLHPDQILGIYMQKTAGEERKDELRRIYNKWISILEHFQNVSLSLQENRLLRDSVTYEKNKENPADKVLQNEKNTDLIKEECRNGEFMLKLQDDLYRNYGNKINTMDEEDIIIIIQENASNYYNSIWNSLSEEEKYIIYDIAQDGVVNLKNSDVINMLLSKGLLITNSGLKLFNRSFRNFVLSEVDKNEVLRIEILQSKAGTNNRIWRSLLLFILSLLGLFIFFTQKEMGNKIIPLIASVATSLQLISNLTGKLSGNTKKV